ncbi:MAG: hypothetical protein GX608_11520 [Lentisphaerae bacterium]|nr:hypothetical protein [Lentisphaerota bacterium]
MHEDEVMIRQPVAFPFGQAVRLVATLMVVLAFLGCRGPLRRDAERLRPGMTMGDVAGIFSEHAVSSSGTGDVASFQFATTLFQTNTPCAFWITYAPKKSGFFSIFEVCDVFFDTNKNIIGYKYDLPD